MAQPASIAQTQWELENSVESLGDVDKLYKFNAPEYFPSLQHRPWQNDHHYFKHVSMSALALLKMSMHAKSGGKYEVMGLMQGKVEGDTFIVLDAFALPVEGTETRVNAAEQANAYMSTFKIASERVLKEQPVVGWYHSHPGYGCWMSGIDVGTQLDHQTFEDPYVAVVIDPVKTMASGKVEIGAFRTYPVNYTPPSAQTSEYQHIPLNKIEEFGVHSSRYYSLDIRVFKSTMDSNLLDVMFKRYWINTLT